MNAGHTPASVAVGMLRSALRNQQDLTAVEVFSLAHERGGTDVEARHYRSLLPVERPRPGEQYAFEVDLDRCTGCKACVTGCHNRNGLDAGETWRSVGMSIGGNDGAPLLRHVTAACHHCLDPACLDGCPVRAYEKDLLTGIVRHLDDQCIGCQYCVMKCPYGVPQYNEKRGIVRKCDLCAERLGAGEAPACVESCPNEAIRITVVSDALDTQSCREGFAAVAGAPDASYTRPTTRYVSRAPNPAAAVERPLQPAEGHPSLVVMLTLTQAAVGLFVCGLLLRPIPQPTVPVAATLSFVLTAIGMTAALCHLGRPLWGFRAVLGLRTSWLSREIVALSVFIVLSGLFLGSGFVSIAIRTHLGIVTGMVGLVAVYCSAMVYLDTPRAHWATPRTTFRFASSALTSGVVLLLASGTEPSDHTLLLPLALVAVAAKLVFEVDDVRRSASQPEVEAALDLLRGPLHSTFQRRLAAAALSILCLVASTFFPPAASLAAFFWLVGEGMERHLFFRAGVAPQMP